VTLRQFFSRTRALLHKAAADRDLDDEIRAHLDLAAAQKIANGMDPAEAHRAARRDFGGVEQVKEIYREQRSFPLLDALRQDVRFACARRRARRCSQPRPC
jgi:hypothetical protein